VLERAQNELTDYQGKGFSIMEISHRSKIFEEVHYGAMTKARELYGIGEEYDVLFLQGGAHLQFAMIPLNLAAKGVAQYADTGVWTSKAIKEAANVGVSYEVVASSKETSYDRIPEVKFSDDAAYGYLCTNNTIYGTQYRALPRSKAPLVVDASSDFFSRPIDFTDVGLLYGGAQKNAGPSGVTVVIIRKDMLERACMDRTPTMLRYDTHASAASLYNTPPTFGIYLLNLTLGWVQEQGGLAGVNRINEQKAALLYGAIDGSGGFYKGHAQKDSRSLMNVCFVMADQYKDKEADFMAFAKERGMVGIKGHRSVGGFRASLYNACPVESVKALVECMQEFEKKNA